MNKSVIKTIAFSLLVAIICAFLSACAPAANPDRAAKALEDAGYTVLYSNEEGDIGSVALPEGVEAYISAYNEDDYIYIKYYNDKQTAQENWDAVKTEIERLQQYDEDIVYKISGRIIYYGTKQAIKDAR